ncbi:MAG: hypothetical protein K9N55_02370, partial [Phycisphaerae bacterium]|nr:hypothetical protein [Phycisphaerae bacterium]
LGTDMVRAHARMADPEANLRNNDRYHIVQIVANDKLKVLLYSEVACMDIGKVRQALIRDEKVDLEFRLNAVRNPAALKGDARQSHLVQLPDNAETLNRYDVIVLGPTDVDGLPPQTAENLYHYVATRGGALILLPGKDHMAFPNWKNAKLKSLLPVTFSGQVSDRRFDVMRADLTDQAQADVTLGHLIQASPMPETLVAYEAAIKKPAASTWVNWGETPLICMHRFGRGRVCLLNCPVLSQWYSEEKQGGALREWLSSVTSRIGSVRTDASRIDVVTRVDEQGQTIHVEALVRDLEYQSADHAMVLLTVNENTHRMQAVGPGRYQVTLEAQAESSFPIRVKAEQHGRFLGERVTTVNQPIRRDEMMRPQANKDFLRQLAAYVGADYVDLEQCNTETAKRFAATRIVEESSDLIPLWRRWSFLTLVCGGLIVYWFLRRMAGLV